MSALRPLGVIFLGAPGVGKGTYANKIGPLFGLTVISTGDLVRNEIKLNTPLGKKIKELSEAGKLVDDEIILNMAKQRVSQPDCKKGFIFDGFPRTIVQADKLQEFAKIDVVLNLSLPQDMLVEKAISRRVCKGCGQGYNLANIKKGEYDMPPLLPKVEGKCDKCNNVLIQRADDTVEIITNRLEVYNKSTAPLIDYYTKKGLLINFDIKKGLGDLPLVVQLFKGLTHRPNL